MYVCKHTYTKIYEMCMYLLISLPMQELEFIVRRLLQGPESIFVLIFNSCLILMNDFTMIGFLPMQAFPLN